MIFPDTQFFFGTQHAETFNTADFADRQFFVITRDNHPDRRKNADSAFADVGCTADTLQHLPAGVDFQKMQVIGIGMHFAFFYPGGDKTLQAGRRIENFFDFQTDTGQIFGNLFNRCVGIQMFF